MPKRPQRKPAKKPTPHVFVIAGPNGAGKTTFAREFLPHYAHCVQFVNADMIAAGLSPFAPEVAAVRAGRLMLEQIDSLATTFGNFGFETTLSGRSYVRLLRELRQRGYRVHIFYLWLPHVTLALERIAERVRKGGHAIPTAVVRRRFGRSLRNFLNLYRPLADEWTLFDNSGDAPRLIASFRAGRRRVVDAATLAAMEAESQIS